MGPFLQGYLMEQLTEQYATQLHQLSFNPYSLQCRLNEDRKSLIWRVATLTDEARRHILEPLQSVESVSLRSLGYALPVVSTTTKAITVKSLTDIINTADLSKARVRFVTPTAFKRSGSYIFMPDVRLIFQNLLMHYCQVYEGNKEIDQETLDYIEQNVRITSYALQSQYFGHVMKGSSKIPAFVGDMTLSVKGPQTMTGLIRMLLRFGEFAGVGIKTSMGMGGIQCL